MAENWNFKHNSGPACTGGGGGVRGGGWVVCYKVVIVIPGKTGIFGNLMRK